MLLHAGALTQRCFQHRDACTPGAFGRRCFYTEMILAKRVFRPRHVYTQVPLHRDAFAHSCCYTLIRLRSAVTCKFFCAEILLHARTFTQTYFDIHWQVLYTQILLHRYASLDTVVFSHMHARMLFHRDVFKCACFYTEIFSHKDTFTKRFSCTEMLSHTETLPHTHTHILIHRDIRDEFTPRNFAHADAITNRGACTKEAFTRGAVTYRRFYTDILLHDTRWQTPILCERVQQAGAKPEFHHGSWWSRCIVRKQNVNFTAFFFQRSKSMYCKRIRQNHPNAEKNVISPQLWPNRRGVTQNRIFGSFRGSRGISWERVDPSQTHIATSFQFLRIDISLERVAFCGHQSTLPRSLQRKLKKTIWSCRML